jgi:hypothetical protein
MTLLRAQNMRLLLVVLLCLEGLQLCLSSQGKVKYDAFFMKEFFMVFGGLRRFVFVAILELVV